MKFRLMPCRRTLAGMAPASNWARACGRSEPGTVMRRVLLIADWMRADGRIDCAPRAVINRSVPVQPAPQRRQCLREHAGVDMMTGMK